MSSEKLGLCESGFQTSLDTLYSLIWKPYHVEQKGTWGTFVWKTMTVDTFTFFMRLRVGLQYLWL